MKQICVLGGAGFVGSALVHKLSCAGYEVKVLTRRRESSKSLILLPNVQVIECDVFNDNDLTLQIRGCFAVVNLVGILHESKQMTFERVHVELPQRVAQICVKQGVKRLLHMSALQADSHAPSAYLRSRAAGEASVNAFASDLHITRFRPSVIFGRGDNFINMFAKLVRLMPVLLLAKPDARFQPIWVEDVATVMATSLEDVDTYDQCYELGGPRVYSLRQIIEFVGFVLGKKVTVVGLNDSLSYLQAYALELAPVKLMTRDNLKSMEVDSVMSGSFPEHFALTPATLEAIVPEYLSDDHPRRAYLKFRRSAGR